MITEATSARSGGSLRHVALFGYTDSRFSSGVLTVSGFLDGPLPFPLIFRNIMKTFYTNASIHRRDNRSSHGLESQRLRTGQALRPGPWRATIDPPHRGAEPRYESGREMRDAEES